MRSIAAVALMVLAVLVAAPTAAPQSSANVEGRPSLEAAVIRALNEVRAEQGLQPLHASPSLRSAARGHSRAMLDYGFFSHDSADGSAFSERIKRYYTNRGWRTWSVGEALLASQGISIDAAGIVKAWLESPPHREIILSPTFRDAGVGALYAPSAPKAFSGADTIVVTADFGLRDGRVSGS
jgi:uncharacterized protein YkwD